MSAKIAEKLVLDEDTVRKRVGKLESAGVIRGWQLIVNPNVFGFRAYGTRIALSPNLTMEETIRKIRLVRGITSIAREMVDILGIGLICENEQVFRKSAELIAELTGTEELTSYAVNYPETDVELGSADWQIIHALRPNPSIRYSEVAKKLGISRRTVQRRLTRLTEGNAIFFHLVIDLSRFEGSSCLSLFVSYTSSRFKCEVDRSIFAKFEDYVLRAGWGSPTHGYFEFIIPNVHVGQEVIDWTRALQGVRDVRLNFKFDRINTYEDALDEIIARRVKRASASQASLKIEPRLIQN